MMNSFIVNNCYSILVKIEYQNIQATKLAIITSQLGLTLCNDSKINMEKVAIIYNTLAIRLVKLLEKSDVKDVNFIQLLSFENNVLTLENFKILYNKQNVVAVKSNSEINLSEGFYSN